MKVCYCCLSVRFVDEHHYDCKEGKISPETVPLCRRCHRTYHDLGVNAFSPDTTTKILEVENKRREIFRLSPMKESDIRRSQYYLKKWGSNAPKKVKVVKVSSQLPLFELDSRNDSQALRGLVPATSLGTLRHARISTGQ